MKFLIDVCAGSGVGMWLLQEGHDVLFVRDRNPRMEDEDILTWAHLEKGAMMTATRTKIRVRRTP
jgi:hypothetical protein